MSKGKEMLWAVLGGLAHKDEDNSRFLNKMRTANTHIHHAVVLLSVSDHL